MKPLGIAMIGYGGIGRVHAMAYRALPFHYGLAADTIKLVGVATTRPETAWRAREESGCDVWTTDYHELLARPDVDIVDVCVPNHLHEEVVVAAAQAGKHIYCEKPLAMGVAEGKRMVDAVARAGVNSQMTFNFRFYPAITRARQLMDAGFVGRVFSFRGRYFRASYIDRNKPLSWRLRKEIAGGGALFDLGSHVLDLATYLLGDFSQVQAMVETLIPERPVAAGAAETGTVDVDDFALINARLASGAVGNIEVSRMGTGRANDLQLEIYGDKGAIRFSSLDPSWLEVYDVRDDDQPLGGMRGFRKLETIQRHADAQSPDWSMPPGFVRTHAESQYQFLLAVSEDRPASPSIADGLHIQRVMAAAIQSSEQGAWIDIASYDQPIV